MRAGIGIMMGSWGDMGVGASMRARVIRERAVLLMGVSWFISWASFHIVGFLNAFCTSGNLLFFLLGLFEIEFLLDFDRGFVLVE